MADTNELKPCPFCGGKGCASERTCDKDSPYNPNDRAYPVVRCGECFTTVCGKDWSSISTAIDAWNKRATATPPAGAALADKAAVDCLRACAQAMRIFDRPDTAAEVDRATDAIAAALRARTQVPDDVAKDAVEIVAYRIHWPQPWPMKTTYEVTDNGLRYEQVKALNRCRIDWLGVVGGIDAAILSATEGRSNE